MAGDGPAPASVSACLRAFLDIQSARAKLYARFDLGHKAFMRNKAESTFRCLMSDLTAAFSDCSRQVIALEAALKDMGRPDLAATLRSVQECERDKLRLTLALQALRQAAAFRTFSWLQAGAGGEAAAEEEEALALLDPHYRPQAHQCQHHHGHGHAHGHAHGHGQGHGQQQEQQQQEEGASGQVAAGEAGSGQADGGQGPAEQQTNGAASPAAADQAGLRQTNGTGGGASGAADTGHTHTHTHGGGACGACGAAGDAAPAEPTRREYEAALKEAMQELDACIRKINDAIGDVRMELEEEEDS